MTDIKHGAFWNSNAHETVFFWMGEEVQMEDFNERLRGMTKSVGESINEFLSGFNAKESINAGQKTLSELHALEEVAKLPLCPACRKLIGEMPS